MNKIKFILPVILLAFVAAACSKEKKIERRLTKKDGKWNITEWTVAETGGSNPSSESYANAGNIVFDDNTFVWNITLDGETETLGGTWTNTDEQLTFIVDGDALVLDIEDESKKEMTLKHSETYTDFNNETVTETTTLKLKKD